jgi:CRISPR system Cascade subunit CasB
MISTVDRALLERSARDLETVARSALRVPADRAALRRGLGKAPSHPMVAPMHRLVAPVLPKLPDSDGARAARSSSVRIDIDAIERAFYTVASLIAAQSRDARDEHLGRAASPSDREDATASDPAPAVRQWNSLGRSLAESVNDTPRHAREEVFHRFEKRLLLMCRQDLDGVHRQLPRLIGYLRDRSVVIDWPRLTVDLARWGREADTVSKKWLQDYYQTARPRGAAGPAPDDADISSDRDTIDSESETS